MEKILNYLTELEQNNERSWYHTHKEAYKEANSEFEMLLLLQNFLRLRGQL